MTLEDRLRRTLAAQAASTRVSADGWAGIDARLRPGGSRPRRAFAVAVSVPLAVVAILVAVSLVGDDPGRRVVTGPAADGPATPDGSPSTSGAGAEPCAALPSDGPAADQALERFFAARIKRDWEVVQPFITSRFAAEIGGRDGFIGASSPHVDRFTVFGDLERSPDRARICARTHELTSADRSYSDDSLLVLRDEDGQWRVDEWRRGPTVTYGASTEYTIWFVAPDAQNCGIDQAERIPAVVSVPEGPDTSRRAIEELLSGPVGRTPRNSAATSLPLDARIRSFTVDKGEAHLDLTDAADAGGGACLQTGRREQLRRTLLSLPGVTDATITAGGRPSGESFQP
jgi:hypothetical protein